MGRATRTAIPNSWQRSIDWRKQIELRGEEIEERVKKKERNVEKKLTFEKAEDVLVQDLKTRNGIPEVPLQKSESPMTELFQVMI